MYAKEVLLQSHNSRMYMNHQILTNRNTNVYYVKTDAFTVVAKQIWSVKSLVTFDNGIGSWRLQHIEYIAYPNHKFTQMNL